MSLNGALGISTGGLSNVAFGLSVISQNVANASTPDYALETATQTSLSASGQGFGVQSGLVVLATDPGLQSEVTAQTSLASSSSTTSAALSALQPVLGAVGNNNDLGSQLTALQSGFSALLADPADGTQQGAVVQAAGSLAQGINNLAGAYGSTRQAAADAVVAGVGQLNGALGSLGSLNAQIVNIQGQGGSTADLQNQRAHVQNTISQLVDVRFLPQPNGSVTVLTTGGAELPTDGSATLSTSAATLGPTLYAPGGGIPGILLGGTDVTGQLTGGTIGANIALRDATIPTYQGQLDEFAEQLSNRFAGQGLTLFSDASGTIPAATGPQTQSGYVGYANAIQVNPAITATPSLVRDGTQPVAGSPTGPSAFTPNPTGLAGFTTLISRVLTFALGPDAQTGVPQGAIATSSLGPVGQLNAGTAPQATLLDAANALTASQAADAASASTNASDDQATQTALHTKLTAATGVDMDTELGQMVILQNAYGANAKIISTIQQLFTDVLNMVT